MSHHNHPLIQALQQKYKKNNDTLIFGLQSVTTRSNLRQELRQILYLDGSSDGCNKDNGVDAKDASLPVRISIRHLSVLLDIPNEQTVRQELQSMEDCWTYHDEHHYDQCVHSSISMGFVYLPSLDEILNSFYVKDMMYNINDMLKSQNIKQTKLSVFELARMFNLPHGLMLHCIKDAIHTTKVIDQASLRRSNVELVSEHYVEAEKDAILEAFYSISASDSIGQNRESKCCCSLPCCPITIQEVVSKYEDEADWQWDPDIVFEYVNESLCSDHLLQGELRGHGGAAIFVPHAYVRNERINMENTFKQNGFIMKNQVSSSTSLLAHNVGVGDFESFVLKSFPHAHCLPSTIMIDIDAIIGPLLPLFIEAIDNSSLVDLNLHLSESLLVHTEDIQAIVDMLVLRAYEGHDMSADIDVDKVASLKGTLLAKQAIWISTPLVEKFRKVCLEKIIDSFADTEAENMLNDEIKAKNSQSTNESEARPLSAKDKRRARQVKVSKKKNSRKDKGDVLPASDKWDDLAARILNSAQLLQQSKSVFPQLEDDQNLIKALTLSIIDGDLSEMFQEVVDKKFNDLRAEATRLNIGGLGDRDKIRNRLACERKFEDQSVFPTSCMMLQIFSKFVDSLYDQSYPESMLAYFEDAFMRGPGLSFVRRLIDYVLFQSDTPDVEIQIISHKSTVTCTNDKENTLPKCCEPIDPSIYSFDDVDISCKLLNDESGECIIVDDPLKVLRTQLPSNIGTPLVKMWKLCKEQYDFKGNSRRELLINYARENCLLICGLPFKVLDKKSEKGLMFERRRELTAMLEKSTRSQDVINLSCLLLLQQVRGIAGFGKIQELTALLAYTNKLPENIKLDFLGLQEKLISNSENIINHGDEYLKLDELTHQIKMYGLSKDITNFS